MSGVSYISYTIDSEGNMLSRERGNPLNQTIPLSKTFKRVLQDMHTAYRYGNLYRTALCLYVCMWLVSQARSIFPRAHAR